MWVLFGLFPMFSNFYRLDVYHKLVLYYQIYDEDTYKEPISSLEERKFGTMRRIQTWSLGFSMWTNPNPKVVSEVATWPPQRPTFPERAYGPPPRPNWELSLSISKYGYRKCMFVDFLTGDMGLRGCDIVFTIECRVVINILEVVRSLLNICLYDVCSLILTKPHTKQI